MFIDLIIRPINMSMNLIDKPRGVLMYLTDTLRNVLMYLTHKQRSVIIYLTGRHTRKSVVLLSISINVAIFFDASNNVGNFSSSQFIPRRTK